MSSCSFWMRQFGLRPLALLSKLEELAVYAYRVESYSAADVLGSLGALRKLALHGNVQISEGDALFFLCILDLSENKALKEFPVFSSACKKLQYMYIRGRGIEAKDLKDFSCGY